MFIDPITPFIETGPTVALMTVSVLLFVANSVINYKIHINYKNMLHKVKNIDLVLTEVKINRQKIEDVQKSLTELKVTTAISVDYSKDNQVMIDNLIMPFIDEMRGNTKNFFQLLNSIAGNVSNLISSINTVLQGLIMTLKK
jgi:hypothetical protein